MNWCGLKRALFFTVVLLISGSVESGRWGKEAKILNVRASKSYKWPIIYREEYNISFFGLEKRHLFDSQKYRKVMDYLKCQNLVNEAYCFKPQLISDKDFRLVHTPEYLESLNSSSTIARITEIPLFFVPNFLLQWRLLKAMKYATQGTVDGVPLALERGWAINVSGGYHHAKPADGGGFCVYQDIGIAIKKLWQRDQAKKIMIVDLDAHQRNGHEVTFAGEKRVHIFDMYTSNNYPCDHAAKNYIDTDLPLESNITDKVYLNILRKHLPTAIECFKPDVIIYNAGTDIYEKDRLGKLKITEAGIIERDEIVFEYAIKNEIPVLMVLSGGYHKDNGLTIGKSIENLITKFNLNQTTEWKKQLEN